MTTWISTHGVGAILDPSTLFSPSINQGSMTIRPTNPNILTGWIHYTIPSPPPNNLDFKKVRVDFSTQSATVDAVEVYLSNAQKFKQDGLQQGQSFELPIAAGQATYGGKGITVSIKVKFEAVGSHLEFQSVAIQV